MESYKALSLRFLFYFLRFFVFVLFSFLRIADNLEAEIPSFTLQVLSLFL